jgi:BMFP domain-containing protein YqiC
MTRNKVCGKGKCKFTDEFCMSGDCPYDTENVAKNVAQRNSQDLERVADTSKTIVVEKEVYESVLKNSVKVADLEAENMQLRQFCEEFNALDVAEENQQLKEMLLKCREKLDKLDYGCEVWQGELTDFINEIDEVLQ